MTKPKKERRSAGGPIDFLPDPELHAKMVRAGKKHLRDLADRIERGVSLDKKENRFVAHILRDAADRIPENLPRPVGHPPQVDPGGLALEFASMVVHKKLSVNEAHEELAGEAGVSITAIKKALKKYGDIALRDARAASTKAKTKS